MVSKDVSRARINDKLVITIASRSASTTGEMTMLSSLGPWTSGVLEVTDMVVQRKV
jgi:hypothetical protein